LAEAERLYVSGHELARDAGDADGAAEGAIGAGNVLEEQARWSEAKAWYSAALQLVMSSEAPRAERWHALLNLHVVARSLGDLDESVEWLRRAEQVAGALEDPAAPAIIHNAWGQLHAARREFGKAIRRFRDALATPAGPWARVNFRLNLGEALMADGRALEAAEEAREAEREALSAGVASKLPEVYRLLGRISAARGNPHAFVLFERALEIVRSRGLPPIEEAQTLQTYADALREGDPERAEELRERAMALYRELGLPGVRDTWADAFGLAHDLPEKDTPGPGGRSQEDEESDHDRHER
jgi:tetratricopeptide (TPR) repeat protein